MKLITKKTDYALRALQYLAKNNGKVPASLLVNKLDVPGPFLRGILQELEKNGVVKSFKGKNGGFILAESPKDIFLTKLIRIFQGDLKLTECFLGDKICPDLRSCVLKRKIESIRKHILNEFNSITISTLMH